MTTTATPTAEQADRIPNTQPNALPEALVIEIFLGKEFLGSITAPQEEFLSAKGNVLFEGHIAKGWLLEGEPTDVLNRLRYRVNGVDAHQTDPVHLSQPRVDKRTGKVRPGTGGNPTVLNTASLMLGAEDAQVAYLAKVNTTFSVKDKSYSLFVKGHVQGGGGPRGEQVVGNVDGLHVRTA